MPSRSGLLLTILAFVAAAGMGVWGGSVWLAPTPEERRARLQQAIDGTVLPRDYARLPETGVRTADAGSLREALAGRWGLVFLGFTHCPDVCPLTLQNLAAALEQWPEEPRAPRVAFVSVDPRRDTAEDAGRYAASFDDRFLGATGEMASLRALADALRVGFDVPDAPADSAYTVEHPSQVFLIDPRGRLRAVFSPPYSPHGLAEDLQAVMDRLEGSA